MDMKKLYLLLLFVVMTVGLSAQRTVSGVVSDAGGDPLIGANVLVKGTMVGTISDIDGSFSIVVPDGYDILLVSYTGFNTREYTLGVSNDIDISLTEGVILDEAVVTALGIKKSQKALGYSVTDVSGDELNEVRTNNILDGLSGKIAGVNIQSNSGAPGASSDVIIRGYSSVTGNNKALWVIDGVPVNNRNNVSVTTLNNKNDDFNRSQDFGNQANDINPEDIESISILKGSAATALYGSRAANGAVIVTTKSGQNVDGIRVDYSGSYTQSRVQRLPHLQNTYGQGWSGLWASNENGSWGPKADGELRLWGNTVNNSRLLKPFEIQEDNLRDFYDFGHGYNNSLAVSGGNGNTNFRLSYSNVREDGVVPTDADSYNRQSISLRGETGTDRFNISASVNYINKDQKVLATGQGDDAGAGKVLFQEIIQTPRDLSIVDMAEYQDQFYNLDNFYTPYAQNPYFTLNETGNNYDENRILGSLTTSLDFWNNFNISWRLGADVSSADLKDWGNVAYITPGSPNSSANDVVGRVSEATLLNNQFNHDLILNYANRLSDRIGFDVSVGHNLNSTYAKWSNSYVTNLTIPGFYDLSNTTVNPISNTNVTERRIVGVYGIANFDFDNWLYLGLQARNDWSSTLPKENNSYFYPAVTLSAILNDAIELPSEISFLKVRASWAQTGNDALPYKIFPGFTAAQAAAGGFGLTRFPLNGINAFELDDLIGNENLSPEITTEVEVGADIRLWSDRIGFDIAYYDRLSNGQIIEVERDPASGYLKQTVNIGEVSNKGIEVLANLVPIRNSDFEWSVNVAYTKNNNLLESLGKGGDETSIVLNTSYSIEMRAEVGKPLGTLHAPTVKTNENGEVIVNPDTGLPLTGSDLKEIGDINPDFTLGAGTALRWKNWKIGGNIDYRKGGVFYSYTARLNYFVGNAWNSQYNDREPFVLPNSVNEIDNGDGTVSYQENTTQIDRSNIFTYWGSITSAEENHVLDRTFFKLRNLYLTYTLPGDAFSRLGLSNASITVFGKNLIIWTPEGNHFVDPEGSTFGVGLPAQIGEFSQAPSNYQFGATLKASF